MTFEEKILDSLYNCGMFEEQAKEVMELVKMDDIVEDMAGRWCDNVAEYPGIMFTIIWVTVKKVALDWIDKNKPEAWFRIMFLDI